MKYNITWDLPYVKLKVWVLVWPRIKPGQDRKEFGRYITKSFFWWFEIHRAYRIVQGKQVKINFVGLCGTDAWKNRPILQDLWGKHHLKATG